MKIIMIIICLFLVNITAFAEEPEELYAQSAVLMDVKSGRVLFEKNGEEQKAMASTTKIMTCILALEKCDMNAVVEFSKEACKQPKVHLGAAEGTEFVLRDLLYSLMLESHNDTAVAVAEYVSGSVEAFADEMNEKAMELGCEKTHFVTPNGLDESDAEGNHVTTAADLARIMSYCIEGSPKAKEFLEITQTSEYSFTSVDKMTSYNCVNHNNFLNMMEGAISGKTGYTAKAGYCYVGALEQDDRSFVVALLACGWPNHKEYKWEDTKKLMNYALENFEYTDIYKEQELEDVKVINGISSFGDLKTEAYAKVCVERNEGEKLNVLLGENDEVQVIAHYDKEIAAPVEGGRQIGEVTYYLNENMIKQYPIVISESVKKKNVKWYFVKMAELYLRQVS